MALIFECIHTEGIAALSYLIGDDDEGVAAVFDPRADVDCYVRFAREKQVAITHVFETHIHVDFLSGARELCARVETAGLFLSHEGDARYGFEHEALRNGDSFRFGSTLITVRHVPGHTPEHVAFLLADKSHPDAPWGVLTGDSLFVGSVGRSDLLGDGQGRALAAQQFRTLRDFYLQQCDGVIIYPAHGQGSPCGANIGARRSSTIGYERRFNTSLQFQDVESFTAHALSVEAPIPSYYSWMNTLNAKGPEVLGNLPAVPGLPPKAFREAMADDDNILVDVRMMLSFGGGHIRGALNIGASSLLSIWAGWLLDPARPILLVLESDDQLEMVVRLLLRTGYMKFAGYLVGGMMAWNTAGLPLEEIAQMTVHEIKRAGKALRILDVRGPDEWNGGHIPNARHIFLGELRERLGELDKATPTAVYCDSGYRASIAASILKQEGFSVCNVPGSWQAWVNAGFPVEKVIGQKAKK